MKTLTASDRSALVRLASSLPKGDATRRAILAGLKKAEEGDPNPANRSASLRRANAKINGPRRFERLDWQAYGGSSKFEDDQSDPFISDLTWPSPTSLSGGGIPPEAKVVEAHIVVDSVGYSVDVLTEDFAETYTASKDRELSVEEAERLIAKFTSEFARGSVPAGLKFHRFGG